MASRKSSASSHFLTHCSFVQFTITSAPEDPYVSIHIRQVGDFTYALGERLGAGPEVVAAMTKAAMRGSKKEGVDTLEPFGSRGNFVEVVSPGKELPHVRIDGPYGAPAEDVFEKEVAILIGAGIGKYMEYHTPLLCIVMPPSFEASRLLLQS
jgi:predicted ferric reductase